MTSRRYNIKGMILVLAIIEVIFWVIALFSYDLIKSKDSDFRLEDPTMLYGFAVIPVLLFLFIGYHFWKNRSMKKFADEKLLSSLFPTSSTSLSTFRFILFRLGVGLLIISLTNPQYGKKKRAGLSQGIEIVLALDISNSMLARDDKKRSRLDIAKRAINKLLQEKLGGDKVGLVIFAGGAYKHTPLTTDFNALVNSIALVEPYMISSQGTDISNALETALTSFNLESETNKAIIVVSDGENHEQDAILAASSAYKENNVKVYTIGMGNPKGATIPVYNQRGDVIGYKKDQSGRTVLTKLNEKNLENIAEAGHGHYTKANFLDLGLNEIVDDINKIEKTKYGKSPYYDYEDHFHFYLTLALLLIVPSLVLGNNSKLEKLNLFNS